MTIEEKRRELFEKRYQLLFGIHFKEDGFYHLPQKNSYLRVERDAHRFTCSSWLAWNAALDAVEIELPAGFWPGEANGPCVDLQDVIESIESTGLGLKVKP